MKIKTLVENTSNMSDLIAEHGLSFLIETENESLIFDTGQGNALLHNISKMNIDLMKVNKIILSHGHYDHTGGLDKAISVFMDIAIYGHPDIFTKKYSRSKDRQRYIGIPFDKDYYREMGIKWRLDSTPIQINEQIKTTGEIKRQTDYENISDNLCVINNGIYDIDPLLDDLSLIVNTSKGISVILGCCHSGIINTLMQVKAMTNDAPIYAIIGGIHLIGASDERISRTIDALTKFDIQKMALCHCTGFKAMARLYSAFGDRLIINNVGMEIELD
ncbi:TPA: MBL fold metallo-hydrolase [bacterium]|mgnify:CR=1 FL=1|nr:MBL fold metallo-hydrolase [bacterium]